ncbi:SUMF1/EgtB/PvdO family nonheme iron enzyme [Solwaraspora sp. WMMD406]|uniref:formylglycine-generating enzyme family protein n=1 Tax=Solwaraspora sp. WMMD406 TaxID=3016095 RepID=UPI002417F06A|nr:SUMF1/EgtB/PvdO family nonheme iron enzyme [Solwaraspora sp. WMMD406]MDG4764437.1 SUMF1/EgtB/PvdO family nonheme iron enzyme [Solwaraspora sp. WMMD406]
MHSTDTTRSANADAGAGRASPLRWLPVPGGSGRFGDAARERTVIDLLVAATPLTYRHLNRPDETPDPDLPVVEVDHAQAVRLATLVGGRLPTSTEWEWIAGGRQRRTWPWGDHSWRPDLARLRGTEVEHTRCGPAGAHPAGATPEGLLDLAGNCWEWTSTATMGRGYVIRGGSYASPPLYARCTFLNAVHAECRSAGIGVRPVRPA